MFKIMNLKQDGQKLRSQIVQDPEKLKKVRLHDRLCLAHDDRECLIFITFQAIIDMEEQVEVEKKTIGDAEVKARGMCIVWL
jgi:hypothetical protein